MKRNTIRKKTQVKRRRQNKIIPLDLCTQKYGMILDGLKRDIKIKELLKNTMSL